MIKITEMQQQIDSLKIERDQYITQANLQVAAMNGGISALEQMVAKAEQQAAGKDDNNKATDK